jgi:hypothetical protein
MPSDAWSCPYCGNPGEVTPTAQTGKEISAKSMVLLLALFVVVPVLLFLLHTFLPDI